MLSLATQSRLAKRRCCIHLCVWFSLISVSLDIVSNHRWNDLTIHGCVCSSVRGSRFSAMTVKPWRKSSNVSYLKQSGEAFYPCHRYIFAAIWSSLCFPCRIEIAVMGASRQVIVNKRVKNHFCVQHSIHLQKRNRYLFDFQQWDWHVEKERLDALLQFFLPLSVIVMRGCCSMSRLAPSLLFSWTSFNNCFGFHLPIHWNCCFPVLSLDSSLLSLLTILLGSVFD